MSAHVHMHSQGSLGTSCWRASLACLLLGSRVVSVGVEGSSSLTFLLMGLMRT